MGAKLCKAGKGGKRGRRRHRRLIRPTELQLNSKLGTTTKRREEGRRGEGGEREKKEEEGEIFTFSSTPSSFRSSSRERERGDRTTKGTVTGKNFRPEGRIFFGRGHGHAAPKGYAARLTSPERKGPRFTAATCGLGGGRRKETWACTHSGKEGKSRGVIGFLDILAIGSKQ